MSDPDVDDATYRQIVAGLMEDGEQFAKSKIKLYRAVLLYRVSQAKKAVGLIAIAFLIAAAALVALLMALVLSLSLSVGPLLAGIIICGAGLLLAALLTYWGVKTFPNLDEKLFDDDFDIAPSRSGMDEIRDRIEP